METVTNKLAMVCVPHHTPKAMPRFQLAQGDTCQKAILPLLQEGLAARAREVEMGKGGEKGGTEEMGHFRGPRVEKQDDPTSALLSPG